MKSKKVLIIVLILSVLTTLLIRNQSINPRSSIEILDVDVIKTENGYIKVIKESQDKENENIIKYDGKFYKGSMLDFTNSGLIQEVRE